MASDTPKLWRTGRSLLAPDPDTEDTIAEAVGRQDEKDIYGEGAPTAKTPGVRYFRTDTPKIVYIREKGSSAWTALDGT